MSSLQFIEHRGEENTIRLPWSTGVWKRNKFLLDTKPRGCSGKRCSWQIYQNRLWAPPRIYTYLLSWLVPYSQNQDQHHMEWEVDREQKKVIRDTLKRLTVEGLSRKEEMILNRLRAGHTLVTRRYRNGRRSLQLPFSVPPCAMMPC